MALFDDIQDDVVIDHKQLNRSNRLLSAEFAAAPEPIAARSTLGEMGAGFKRGLFVAVPEMAGGAIKSIADVDSDWYKKGQDLQESAQAIAKLPEFQKSATAEAGLVNKVLVSGAEGVGQMAPIIATGAINPYAGAALAAGMYGGSTYQDTKERILKQEGLDDRFAADNPDDPRVAKAKNTGLTTGAIQGLGEGAMSLVGGKFVKAALPAIGKATVESILGKTAKPGLAALKEYAKGIGLELAGETITEPLQDEAQAAVERAAGLKDAPRFMEQAAGSAQGGFGTALLLAPFGIPAHLAKYSRSASVQSALTDPAADPAARAAAAHLVATDLGKVDQTAADNFLEHAAAAIGDEATTGSAPYALDLTDTKLLQPFAAPTLSETVSGDNQQVSALPGQQADTSTGTAGASPAPGGADVMGDIPEFGSPAVANAPAQPAIAGPAVEGMLGNLQAIAPDGTKNSLASALLAGGNPYRQFAEQPFANAPVQPAIAGAGVEGLLVSVQPAPSSPRYQAMQWAEQQMQDQATSKFERQNLNALMKAADPEKRDLVKYWASSTNQRKQPATIAGLSPQGAMQQNDSQQRKTAQVTEVPATTPGGSGKTVSPAPKRDRAVKPAQDDMITAIAKLGGLNQDQAIAQWGNAIKDGKRDLARHATKNGKAGFLHVISKTGKNLDDMREALEEQGYLQPGSSIEDMYAKIDQHLGGRPTYSNQNQQQVEDQDLSVAPDGVEASDYPFDLSGIYFPEKERKRLKFLKQVLKNAKNEKTKAQARKALERFAEQHKLAEPDAPRKSQPDADQQYLDDVSKRFEEKFKSAIFGIDEDQQKQNLKEGRYVIDRLPQEAEQAVLTGKLGAAASIAGRSSGTDIADAGQGTAAGEAAYQVKQNQAKALTAWAKEHDLLIDATEFNRQWSVDKIKGAEHDVYFTNDNRVIKRLTPTFTTWYDYFNRVALHNYLFPDTAYTLSGFMLDNGKLFAVVEQPFIKQHDSQPVTDADIFADTEQMGFTHKPSKGMTGDEARAQDFYHPDGIVMTDLHDANVFRNYAGSLRYIDAIIWMDYATKYQRLAERYGLSDKADLDIEVDVEVDNGQPQQDQTPVPMLLGEKIGGARKDLESSGTSSKPKKPASDLPSWKRRYAIAEVTSRDSQNFGKWSIRDTTTGRPLVRKYFDTLEEAEQFLPLAVFAVKHRVQLDGNGTWKIVRNVTDRKRVTLKDGFTSEEEANRYSIEHAVELIEQNTYFGEEIIASPETVLREGPQYRTGNATAAMFMDTFGFRSAEFGNWNNEAERQEILNHAFDSLMDMADILNIPPKAVSLNGELAIAFGARGQGLSGAAAHYEPGYAVINLTKMAGAGHLFHEWLHAMDNYFARQDGRAKSEKELNKRGDLVYPAKKEDKASDGFSRNGSGVRKEVQDAFLHLMETIWYKTEQYVEDTEKAERFVQSALDNVSNQLADIRRNIATERRYGARKRPATAEHLQRFDALADKLKDPAGASVEWRHGIGVDPNQPMKRGNMGQNRWTNDTLEELSSLVKAVTGRSGFNAEGHGEMNYLASRIRDLHNRNSMLQEARSRDTNTKKVPTAYRQEAYKIDQGRSSDYWTEKWEMLARAGSAYMEDQLKNNDRRNDFLSFGSDNKYYRLFNVRPFPEGQERESINAAFDNLFTTLKTKETDKGVALYSATEEAGSLFTSGLDSDSITDKKISLIKGITPVSAAILRGKGLQPVEVQGETSDMLRAVAQRFGLKAIFYRAQQLDAARDGGKQTTADRAHSADGFITGADKKTIFLNFNSGRHLQFILGHEISHALDLNNAKAYQQLLVDLYPYLNKEKVAEYEDYLKTNPVYKDIDTFGTYKEVVADAVGELFVSKNGWSTLASEKPSLFSKLADAVIKVLNKIKSLFTNELKPVTFFTDYARVNRILLNAIKDYAENNGGTDGLTDTTKEYYAAAGNYLPERPFYSAAFKLVSDAKQTRWGSVQDLLNWLKGKVTQDEINQLGLAELEGKPTKQEVLDQIAANSVEFKDVVLGISKSFNRDAEEERMKQELFDEAMEYDFGDGNWWYEPISSRKSELLDEIKATEKKVDPADEDNEAYEFTYNGKTKTYEGWNSPDDDEILELFDLDDEAIFETIPYEERKEGADYAVDQADFSNKLDEMERDHRYDPDDDDNAAMFEKYTEPGAVDGSYREMFVTVPELKDQMLAPTHDNDLATFKPAPSWNDGHSQYKEIQNPVVRIRFNDREADGKRILFVEEMQGPSDANQQNMPDYLKKRIYDIGVKRILAYAKEQGYDGISWTTGDMQAKRYDLSKHISKIEYEPTYSEEENPNNGEVQNIATGLYDFEAYDTSGKSVINKEGISLSEIEELAGKEIAGKIKDGEGKQIGGAYRETMELSGLDLKVGGEGLKALYDRTLPALFKNYGKGQMKTIGLGETVARPTIKAGFTDKTEAEEWLDAAGDENFIVRLNRETGKYDVIDKTAVSVPIVTPYIPITDTTPASYPRFSLNSPATTNLNAAELQQEFAGVPFKSKIKVVQTAEELPGFGSKSLFSKMVEGQYKEGTIYLVAGNLPSVERARVVALGHELTHAGQNTKLVALAVQWFRDAQAKGEKGSPFQQAARKILKEEAAKRGYNINKEADFVKAVKEATAVVAEYAYRNGETSSLMNRLLMYLKHWLRKAGIAIKFSDKELLSTVTMMMRQGEQNLTNGIGPDGGQFETKPEFSLASTVSSAILDVDFEKVFKATRDNWKQTANPLDWSRTARWFDDWTPESIKAAFGYLLAVPHFQAERDATKRPFVDASENREIDRMDMMLQFLGFNPGQDDTRSLKEKTWDFFTKWQSGQHQTDWEKINQRRADLSADQKKALDALFVEGDVSSASYSSLEKALMNPRIARTKPTTETFALYRDIRNHMDNHVAKIREQRMERMMREAGVDEGAIKAHIADYRNDLREVGGWMTRNHGDGEHATAVYHIIKDLKFEIREVKDNQQQAYLPYFPGNAVLTRLQDLAKQAGHKVKVTPRGAVIVTGVSVQGFVDEAAKILPEIGTQRVMVFSRYHQTKGAARNHADLVKQDLKAAMPHNYRPAEQYEVTTRQVDMLNESMYQNMRSDMAVEALLEQSAQRALKRGDMSKEQYNEFKQDLVQNTAEVLMGRAAGRYQIRRAEYLIEGYDTENALALYQDYMMGVAGMMSKADYAAKQFENFRTAKIPVKQWAAPYIFDSLRNQGLGDRISGNLRAFASLWYMGLKPASALINATQNYTLGIAELGRHIKKGSPLLMVAKANADIIKGKLTQDEEQLFESAIYRQQEMGSALSEITGHNEAATSKAGKLLHNITGKTLALFQNVEVMNRKTMILAGYRAFKSKDTKPGLVDQAAFDKAMEINSSVNFNMHRGNLPGWARTPVGHTLYALQSFTFNSFNWMFNRLTSGERRDVQALLRYAGAIMTIGGAAALAGGDELDKLYRKLFGKSIKLEFQQYTHKNLKQFGSFGELVENFAWHGLGGVAGLNISNSLRLQIPVVSQVLSGESAPEAMGGVFSGLLQKGQTAVNAAAKGDAYRAVEAAAPEAISGAMRAYRQAIRGVTTMGGKQVFDENGKPVKYSAADAALRVAGLQPLAQSKRTEVAQTAKEIAAEWRSNRQDVIDAFRIADTTPKKQLALKQVQKFNVDLRGSQAAGLVQPISMETLRNAAQQRRTMADKKKSAWQRNHLN